MSENKEKGLSIAEQIEGQREHQAFIRLDAEVRKAARAQGVDRAEVDGLVAKAREVFKVVNGEARAFAADGRTVLRREDGAVLSVSDWVLAHGHSADGQKVLAHGNKERVAGTLGPSVAALPKVERNPFKRVSWNLTEQMRVQRRDPELAARLREEA